MRNEGLWQSRCNCRELSRSSGASLSDHLFRLGGTYREPTRVDKTMGGILCRLRMSRSIVIATGSLAGNVSMSASSSNSSKCSASVVSSGEKGSTALGNEAGFLVRGFYDHSRDFL